MKMKYPGCQRIKTIVLFCVCSFLGSVGFSAPRVFFPFDNGLNDIESLKEQAVLLKELGYDGIGGRGGDAEAKLAAVEGQGLRMFTSYMNMKADRTSCVVGENLKKNIRAYRGHGVMIWLGVPGTSTDEIVVPAIQEVADLAAENGLEVALYPHAGEFMTSTAMNCLRLAKKADRPNLGVSFNLCHFLKQNPSDTLEPTLRTIAPYLKLVQISGADDVPPGTAHWDRLIQPLGQGSFDVSRVLRCLDEIGYEGGVNLQCHDIRKPAREHLSQSMDAWKRMNQNLENKE